MELPTNSLRVSAKVAPKADCLPFSGQRARFSRFEGCRFARISVSLVLSHDWLRETFERVFDPLSESLNYWNSSRSILSTVFLAPQIPHWYCYSAYIRSPTSHKSAPKNLAAPERSRAVHEFFGF